MRVTLKRADFYARAALKAATETNYGDASVAFSVYAPELADPAVAETAQPVVAKARTKLLDQQQLALDLIAACYAIRSQLDVANGRLGISDNLTRKERLASEEGRLRALLKAAERGAEAEASLAVVLAKAAALRNRPKDSYGFGDRTSDTVKVALLDETDIERLRRQLKRLTDDRAEINDVLTTANVSNTVTLDAAVIAVLRRADLLPAA
jgi:hypothetical protein